MNGDLNTYRDTTLPATLRMPVEAGALVRGQVRRTVESYAWQMGLDIDIKESRGWLESTFLLTVHGPANKLVEFGEAVKRWAQENG